MSTRARGTVLALLAASLLTAGRAEAQDRGEPDAEDFEDEDPYTRGKPEKLARLGYVSFGPFAFVPGENANGVRETLGVPEILWVETAHFQLGSTLPTYRIPLDEDEREQIERDLAKLKKRLGRLQPPKKELDPWLRLHLFAQRLEELYEDFCARFGLEPADFPVGAPHLGQEEKFRVLLCDQRSSLGRFLRRYVGVDQEHSYRYRFPEGGFLLAISAQALNESGYELDAALHCALAGNLIENFLDAYRDNVTGTPAWWRFGLAHHYSRRIDPRWTQAIGYEDGRAHEEEDRLWDERVANLVRNDFFASAEEMFGWREYADLDVRDHMIAWSKVDFLLEIEEAELGEFLDALCRPPPEGTPEAVAAERVRRQVEALQECLGFTPAELDQAWAKHVRRGSR